MKPYYKIFAAVGICGFMTACADQDTPEYTVDKPESIIPTEALNEYANIKEYIDRSAYPNFKIGCALGASDYNENGVVYRVANQNFDEITLGNAMKYASVVGDEGNMDFTLINDLLDNTEAAGMSVYGHTLAWHAQQNVTWLNSLLADATVVIGPEDRIPDCDVDFSEYSEFPYTVIGGFTPTIEDGILIANFKGKNNQFYLVENLPTTVGTEYEIKINARASKTIQVPIQFGSKANSIKVELSTEWQVVTFNMTATEENSYLMVDVSRLTFDLEVASVSVGHYPPSSRPLTEEEKVENLKNEMTRWIRGMMEACNGRVKSWDMINEAISGGGNVDGYYDLQHASTGGKTDFFWQDYLGSENYGPVVSKAARAAFEEFGGNPSELKLFVNDYNLESDWDNNKKVKSLVYWVNVWEKGGAKIDGLSSQMHVSYYEDKDIMSSKASHYVEMLKIMANTGKLVRISELDMGYVDINGTDVITSDMTSEQLQNMANYYRFIIQMYLKIVPAAQQYGICQWCLTDAPKSSGWRPNQPVGLWTEDWARKTSYAAFCDALSSSLPSTEDYFEFLNQAGLTHYISTPQ